jgi:hypothetical protein
VNFPKEYETRDGSTAVLEDERDNRFFGYIQESPEIKILTSWGKYTMNSTEKPEWDLMKCKKEKEIY